MNLIDKDLLLVLEAYGQGWIGVEELRAFLAERFFPLPTLLNPFEAMVVGEMELRLAEMDRGDRSEEQVREAAKGFALIFRTFETATASGVPEPALI